MFFLGGQQTLTRTKTLLFMPMSRWQHCPHRISNAIMPALQFLNDSILTAIDDTVTAQALSWSKIFLKTDNVTHTCFSHALLLLSLRAHLTLPVANTPQFD